MSDIIVQVTNAPEITATITGPSAVSVNVGLPEIIDVAVSAGMGPKGDSGVIQTYYGQSDPPDPTGLADGTLFFKY